MKNPYEIIQTPLITEKLQAMTAQGTYGFRVDKRANKIQIKSAIEKIYKVKVDKVNVVNMLGKKRRLRFKEGYTSSWKKAIIRLKKGHTISLA